MKKLLSFSFQHKIILILVLLVNVPLFLTGYVAKDLMEETILAEKENKLLALTRVLDANLEPGGYAAILQRAGASRWLDLTGSQRGWKGRKRRAKRPRL